MFPTSVCLLVVCVSALITRAINMPHNIAAMRPYLGRLDSCSEIWVQYWCSYYE